MSTSIYKSDCFKMGYRSSSARKSHNTPEKVKRSLFGPVDHEANRRFIEKHLNWEYTKGCHKWNFNFRDEVQLKDDGDFIWNPPSPVAINRKRKPAELPDISSGYYFQPIQGSTSTTSCMLEPLRPVPRSPEMSKPNSKVPKQSLITDYLAKSKRPVISSVKETSDDRPNKIPKVSSHC